MRVRARLRAGHVLLLFSLCLLAIAVAQAIGASTPFGAAATRAAPAVIAILALGLAALAWIEPGVALSDLSDLAQTLSVAAAQPENEIRWRGERRLKTIADSAEALRIAAIRERSFLIGHGDGALSLAMRGDVDAMLSMVLARVATISEAAPPQGGHAPDGPSFGESLLRRIDDRLDSLEQQLRDAIRMATPPVATAPEPSFAPSTAFPPAPRNQDVAAAATPDGAVPLDRLGAIALEIAASADVWLARAREGEATPCLATIEDSLRCSIETLEQGLGAVAAARRGSMAADTKHVRHVTIR